jgi:alcohol dehydrogenase class IV
MQFEFFPTPKIIFGPGKINSIGDLILEFGKKAFIVFNGPDYHLDKLLSMFDSQEITFNVIKIEHEPTVDLVASLVDHAHRFSPDLVIGIGGGSAIDTSKAVAALSTNPGEVLDYLEVIGSNEPLKNPSLPLIAVPTTSGTGSEVTRNAVLEAPIHRIKVSLRSQFLIPRIALIDPELTLNLPKSITAYTGLDALTQLIEPYTSNLPNPMIDSLCMDGIQRISKSISCVYDDGSNYQARENMSIASLYSGLALANARLGAVHGLAGPLGGEISAPHGAIVAALLPNVMEMNISELHSHEQNHPVLERYLYIAKILTGDSNAKIEAGIKWVRDFCKHAKIPSLSVYNLQESSFDNIVKKAINASSMKGNPITLSEDQLRSILRMSL